MSLQEDLIKEGRIDIALLKEDCDSKAISDLENVLDRMAGLCAEVPDGKSNAFDDANAALDAILKDCPASADIVEKLRKAFAIGSSIKCGG